jgi:hypothetical protein
MCLYVSDWEDLLNSTPPEVLCDMMANNDPLVTAWLSFERARRITFKNFPSEFPDFAKHMIDDLASAGFFYTGQADWVQCVFCQCILGGWTYADDPRHLHKELYPNCPLMQEQPTANQCETAHQYCCHDLGTKSIERRRHKDGHADAHWLTRYVLVLAALAFAIGIDMPLAVAWPTSSAVPQGGSPDSNSVFESVLQQLQPWRGIVAVKQRGARLVDKFHMLKYPVDLKTCTKASQDVQTMIGAYEASLQNLGLSDAAKNKYAAMLANAKTEQQTSEPAVIISELPAEEEASATLKASCPVSPWLPGMDFCQDLENEASILADAATTTQKANLPGAVAKVMALVDRFSAAKSQLHSFVNDFRLNRISTYILPAIKCALRQGECKSEKMPVAVPLKLAQIKPSGNQKSLGTGLQLSVATSCPDNTVEVGQYKLTALPYTEQGQRAQVRLLKNDPVWFESTKKPIGNPASCSGSSTGLVCLRSQDNSSDSLTGRITRSNVPAVAHKAVAFNQYLVSAQERTEGSLICANQTNNISLHGIYSIRLPDSCSFKMITGNQVQELFPTKEHSLANEGSQNLPLILPLGEEAMSPIKFTSIIMEYPYVQLWNHFSVHYPYYIFGLIAGTAALIFCRIGYEAASHLRGIRRATRGLNDQKTKRVYIRNPLLR